MAKKRKKTSKKAAKKAPEKPQEPAQEAPQEPAAIPTEEAGVYLEPQAQIEFLPLEPEKPEETAKKGEEKQPEKAAPVNPEEQMQGYRRLTGRIHRFFSGIVQVSTDDGVKLDDDDLRDLEEAGAHLAQKYDAKGWLGKNWPEILYALTLASVSLKTWWRYAGWKKLQKRENQRQEERGEAAAVDLPPSPR